MSNPYDVLGVSPSATREEVRLAYKRKAMLYHPDRGGDATEFAALHRAYERIVRTFRCETCNGQQYVTRREGVFVRKVPCPTCQESKK